MVVLKLTQGQLAYIDEEDLSYIGQWKWRATKSKDKKTYYAIAWDYTVCPRRLIMLHRTVLRMPTTKEDSRIVDHMDRNGLNCQKSNLRLATMSQSMANRGSWGRSKYRGVSLMRCNKGADLYWSSRIMKDGKSKLLGIFPYTSDGEILAAKAYDKAAVEIHGEYANVNIKPV